MNTRKNAYRLFEFPNLYGRQWLNTRSIIVGLDDELDAGHPAAETLPFYPRRASWNLRTTVLVWDEAVPFADPEKHGVVGQIVLKKNIKNPQVIADLLNRVFADYEAGRRACVKVRENNRVVAVFKPRIPLFWKFYLRDDSAEKDLHSKYPIVDERR